MNNVLKLIFFSLISLMLSQGSWAINIPKCGKMMNKGWYRQYDYFGMYFHGITVSLDQTKKQGSTYVTTESSKQSITGMSDFGITTNSTTGSSQSSSSWGECSLFAQQVRDQRLKQFIAEHKNELRIDLAKGKGEYLQAISELYLCRQDKQSEVSKVLRANFQHVFSTNADAFQEMKKALAPTVRRYDHCLARI